MRDDTFQAPLAPAPKAKPRATHAPRVPRAPRGGGISGRSVPDTLINKSQGIRLKIYLKKYLYFFNTV